jgi:hypothetical protein
MQVSAPGQAMSMRLDHDRVEVDNDGSKVTIERGETGPFTVEGLVDTPTGTMTIGADGKVTIAGNPGNQFVAAVPTWSRARSSCSPIFRRVRWRRATPGR